MYWNNPIVEVNLSRTDQDPIQDSMHGGCHALFFDHSADFSKVTSNQTLSDLCEWANQWLVDRGVEQFLADPMNHYDISNLVKINIWVSDIRQRGIIKPWLMLDQGDGTWLAGTGETRLRCLEVIPEIKAVPAFISTRSERRSLYERLESVDSLAQFADKCNAASDQNFLFRLTDSQAPYGLYWYEYDAASTREVTPGQVETLCWFGNYARRHPNVRISPNWFSTPVPWHHYHAAA